jgi:hypothetical protein
MIERIEWNSSFKELPNPFMRGKGERPLRITFHSQSFTNLSDEETSALELLRELVTLEELKPFQTSPGAFPYIKIQESDPKDDTIPVELVHNNKTLMYTGVWNKRQRSLIVSELARTNFQDQETIQDALNALILSQAHLEVDGDIFITKSPFLLENRDKSFVRETNPRTPIEAAKIVGLFLRSRGNYTFRVIQGAQMSFNRGLFYWVLVRHQLPNMWKYFSACVSAGKKQNEDLMGLGESVLIRAVRAVEALDEIGIQFHLPQNNDTRDQMMYHFDYLTLVLSGALDAQARIANKIYKITDKVVYVGFQKGNFVKQLNSNDTQQLFKIVNDQKFKDLKTLLYELRNTIHAASLKTIAYQESSRFEHSFITLPSDIKKVIWDAAEGLGSAQRWGLIKKGDVIYLEPYSYSTSLVEESLKAIDSVAAATDVDRLFYDKPIPSLREEAPDESPFIWGKRLSFLI